MCWMWTPRVAALSISPTPCATAPPMMMACATCFVHATARRCDYQRPARGSDGYRGGHAGAVVAARRPLPARAPQVPPVRRRPLTHRLFVAPSVAVPILRGPALHMPWQSVLVDSARTNRGGPVRSSFVKAERASRAVGRPSHIRRIGSGLNHGSGRTGAGYARSGAVPLIIS